MKYTLLLFAVTLLSSSCSHIPESMRPSGIAKSEDIFQVSWVKAFDPNYESGNLPISLNSPLIHKGYLYVGNARGEMGAYNLDNGRALWVAKEKGPYHAGAIVVGENIIYGNVQGRLFSRNLITGESSYEVDLGASIETRPTLYKGRLFIQTRDHKIFAIDATSGKVLWAYKRSVPFLTTLQRASRPFVDKDKVYVGFADGAVISFATEDGVVLWERKVVTGQKFIDVDTDPLFFNKHLLVGSLAGDLVVMSPESGQVLRRLPYPVSRRPYIVGENLIVLTGDGRVIVLDEYYNEVSVSQISNEALSSLTPWKDGHMISSVGRHVYYVSKEDFKVQSKFELGSLYSAVFGEVSEGDGRVALYSSRNRLYVFK